MLSNVPESMIDTIQSAAHALCRPGATGFDHTDDMLMGYLPRERILAEADAYTPPATPTTPLVAAKVPYAAALYANVRRHKLDVQTIAPFHGMRTADMAEVARQARP